MKACLVYLVVILGSGSCNAAETTVRHEKATAVLNLTPAADFGGGGCLTETTLFLLPDRDFDFLRAKDKKQTAAAFERLTGRRKPYFLSTVGCTNDAIAIGINGATYLLKNMRVEKLGYPAVYVDDNALRVTIKAVDEVYTRYIKDTDCTETMARVKVRVDLAGQVVVADALSLRGCP